MMNYFGKNRIEHPTLCVKCGKGAIIKDLVRGELLCSNCGYIIKETEIDTRPEWRAFPLS